MYKSLHYIIMECINKQKAEVISYIVAIAFF